MTHNKEYTIIPIVLGSLRCCRVFFINGMSHKRNYFGAWLPGCYVLERPHRLPFVVKQGRGKVWGI